MAYLIAKYCVLFLLTGLLGFLIGRWSVRRLFVDVTDSYETLSKTSVAVEEAPWDEIRARFDDLNGNVRTIVQNEFRAHPYPEIPRAFFDRIEHGIANVTRVIENIPEPEKVDLSGIGKELGNITTTLQGLSGRNEFNELSETVRRLSDQIAAIPEPETPIPVDLAPLEEKVISLQHAIETIPQPEPPVPVDLSAIEAQLLDMKQTILGLPTKMTAEPVDLTPLEHQLSVLKTDISNLPTPAMPADLDLSAVTRKIEALESLVSRSAASTQNALNLSPMYNRLEQLEILIKDGSESSANIARQLTPLGAKLEQLEANLAQIERTTNTFDVAEIKTRIDAIKVDMNSLLNEQQEDSLSIHSVDERLSLLSNDLKELKTIQADNQIDTAPLEQGLSNISAEILESRKRLTPESLQPVVDLAPVAERLDRMESLLTGNEHRQLDQFDPIDEKLSHIQAQLSALNSMSMKSNSEPTRTGPSIGPKLLNRAEFGRKDKLQEITGIGPKLERTLNRLGVYYYWQIAAWDKRDIRAVDANLETFRGRIERDDWVRQAKRLRKGLHAAPQPAGRELASKLN